MMRNVTQTKYSEISFAQNWSREKDHQENQSPTKYL